MNKYKVHLFPIHRVEYIVEAENQLDAIKRAEDIFDNNYTEYEENEYADGIDDFCIVDPLIPDEKDELKTDYEHSCNYYLDLAGKWTTR